MIPLFIDYDDDPSKYISEFNHNLFFSSKDMTYETPIKLFNLLNSVFNFNIDVCAAPATAKCKNYFTPEIDGLKQDWIGTCWMNPPYGREIGKWMLKAYNESKKNLSTVVCLIPSRTDTKYEHNIVFKYSTAICFIKGRLRFGNSNNSAPFPSQLVIFGNISYEQIKVLNSIGCTFINHKYNL